MCNRKSFIETKKVIILFACLLATAAGAFAQNQILFINPSQGKLIKAKEGDMLSVKYKGYLGQTETFKNTLTMVNDSTFTLGVPMMEPMGIFGLNGEKQFQYKEIRYSDIVAFRRSGLGRTVLKSTLTLGAALGSFFLLNSMYERNNISNFGKFGVSIGIGLTLNVLINVAFPDKPNHKIEEGWQINVIKD